MTTDQPLQGTALLRLMTWLSPSFPVGAYTYSHGVEYAVEVGLVKDEISLTVWLETILLHGAAQTDAVLFARGYEAVVAEDADQLWSLFELADVMRGSKEMALESSAQGAAFWQMLMKVWPDERLQPWQDRLQQQQRKPAYPVAVALAAAYSDIPLNQALYAYLHATAVNLISAGVRLVPLGQTAGQKATAALEEIVIAAGEKALKTDINDIGAATPMVDWTSISHETQYTRLFRS